MSNSNLLRAKAEKNDEFYTRYEDIEKEMKYYVEYFKDRTIYCNCDDYRGSNFFKYFDDHFGEYGLRRLITTGYSKEGRGVYYDRCKDYVKYGELNGNGDFRSEESLSYLEQCDIVCSNPPFSLFKEYIHTLEEYGKKYIVLGNMNAITYKEIFPLFKENKMWWGGSIHSGGVAFTVPYNYTLEASTCGIDENGKKFIRVKGIRWFTNLDHKQRHEGIYLTKKYDAEVYPTYDNYDAIEVSKTKDIPMDYDGVLGVPITFLNYYNPEQFEIVGFRHGDDGKDLRINGKCPYYRILIRRRPTWNQDEHF